MSEPQEFIGKQIAVLDKGWIELLDIMGDDLAIVNAARVSFLGESKGSEKDKKLLFYLMRHRHTSPFEQVEFKFRVKCPLFVARQWLRHRTWSYNEVSRRYSSVDIEFYEPERLRRQASDNKQASEGFIKNDGLYLQEISDIHQQAFDLYTRLIKRGVAREQARVILPVSLYTQFYAKVDAHNLMHFLSLRLASDAQIEIRAYAQVIYQQFFRPALPWTAEAFEKYILK